MSEVWYRYEDRWSSNGDGEVEIHLRKFEVIKHTPKGVWLDLDSWRKEKRFVLCEGRKRFALPTKQEARVSFLARKRAEIGHLKTRLRRAELALSMAE